jgi:hypothetical protein
MNKFVGRMLELGAELDKAVSPIEISMVINDAEILYKNHIEQLNIPDVVQQSEQLFAFLKHHYKGSLKNPSDEELRKYIEIYLSK